MTEDEIELMPNEYVLKFGTFVLKSKEMQMIAAEEVNKDTDMYQ